MGLNFATYKAIGVIYDIEDTQLTKNGFPKRNIILEIPVVPGRQKTTLSKFLVMGDECASLDWYEKGTWVNLMFQLDGFLWTKPETGEKILLQSLKVIDIQKRDNPFESQEKEDDHPDALSPDPVAELANNVKDYSREVDKELPFESDDMDPLPF